MDVKIARRRHQHPRAERFVPAGQVVGKIPEARHHLERLDLLQPVDERGIGNSHPPAPRRTFGKNDDVLGGFGRIGDGLEQNSVHDAEDGCVSADTERKRQHDRGREPWIVPDGPQREPKILTQLSHLVAWTMERGH